MMAAIFSHHLALVLMASFLQRFLSGSYSDCEPNILQGIQRKMIITLIIGSHTGINRGMQRIIYKFSVSCGMTGTMIMNKEKKVKIVSTFQTAGKWRLH